MTDEGEIPGPPREVCFLLGEDDVVLWSDASESPVALPDSRTRWEAIWGLRDRLVEIAHTHPLGGAYFSREDETTMAALDAALGRKLRYSVVTPNQMLRRTEAGDALVDEEPGWVPRIRTASGIPPGALPQPPPEISESSESFEREE